MLSNIENIGDVATFGKTVVIFTVRKAVLNDMIAVLMIHDLRHTFASRLVQGGVPLYDMHHLMGYKLPDMVKRYAHLAPDYQEKAVQALN